MRLDFELDIDPATIRTAQQKGERVIMRHGGKPFIHHYTKKSVQISLDKMRSAFLACGQTIPQFKSASVDVVYIYSIRDAHLVGSPRTKRPDLDNLLKNLLDCMTGLCFWKDDAVVWRVSAIKRFATASEIPRVLVSVEGDII